MNLCEANEFKAQKKRERVKEVENEESFKWRIGKPCDGRYMLGLLSTWF